MPLSPAAGGEPLQTPRIATSGHRRTDRLFDIEALLSEYCTEWDGYPADKSVDLWQVATLGKAFRAHDKPALP